MEDNRPKHDRKYFEQLLKDVDRQTRRSAQEKEQALMSEDPMGINYARWATEEEMMGCLTAIGRDAKEVPAAGVPIFCKDGTIYTDTKDSHSLIIGSSGSKKTGLFILPSILTLMKAGESMIITDPKAELYERTSGVLRENGYEVLCINFRDDSCQNCWNPLDAPRRFFNNGKFDVAIGLLSDFSNIAVPAADSRADPFWEDSSRATFMGLLLIMFLLAEDPSQINIRGLLRMRNALFSSTNVRNSPFLQLYKLMDPGSLAASYLSALAIAPEKTMSSILATLDTHLLKFIMRPDLTDMLCRHDVDFSAIGKEKTAIFLVMPDEKETYHGLISIFIQQCYESLIFEAQNLPGKTLPRRVNFLLDEFSSLPPIKEFPAMIAAARSRNIRFNIVVQSEKQLRSRYREEADTIKGNCNNWFFLYSRELETLEELCRLCGTQKSGSPLITPSRLQRLDKDKGEVLVIHGRQYPFLSQLDDISQYDNEQWPAPYCKPSATQQIQIFKADEVLQTRSEAWITARLDRNTVKQAEAEQEEQLRAEAERKKKEAEEAALLEEKRKLARSLANIDWLCVQGAPLEDNPILDASRRYYSQRYTGALPPLHPHTCQFVTQKTKDNVNPDDIHRVVPGGEFSLNYISMLCEMNAEHIVLSGQDAHLLAAASHHVFRRCLTGGQSVPIFFDMSELFPDWNPMMQKYRSNEASMLMLHLANLLFGTPLPPVPKLSKDDDLREMDLPLPENIRQDVDRLIGEFSAEPSGMPKYLLILQCPEAAPYAFDGLWQLLTASTFPNVRLFITTTAPEFLTDQCANHALRKGYGTHVLVKRDEREGIVLSARPPLFYDEKEKTVKAKQPELSMLLLEVTSCCQS